ncbi:MAG: hypothetical protein ABIN89_06730, partial [Chitinophagaceae bacterium]
KSTGVILLYYIPGLINKAKLWFLISIFRENPGIGSGGRISKAPPSLIQPQHLQLYSTLSSALVERLI